MRLAFDADQREIFNAYLAKVLYIFTLGSADAFHIWQTKSVVITATAKHIQILVFVALFHTKPPPVVSL